MDQSRVSEPEHQPDFVERLANVRRQLVEARNYLRDAQDDYRAAKLRAEFKVGEQVEWDLKKLGLNAEDRKRTMDAGVESDEDCQRSRTVVRSLEASVTKFEAELEILLDERREREWQTRAVAVDLAAHLAGAVGEVVAEPVVDKLMALPTMGRSD